MTPEQLQAWQPQASIAQLHTFIEENPTLFQLLEETWQKFNQHYQPPPAPVEYAQGFDINDLSLAEPSLAEQYIFQCDFPADEEQKNSNPFVQQLDSVLQRISTCAIESDEPPVAPPLPTLSLEKTALPTETNQPTLADSAPPEPTEPSPIPAHTLSTEIPIVPHDLAESTDMPIFPHTSQPTPIARTLPTIPQLPNARVGENYDAALPAEWSQRIHSISFTPECGLTWQAESARIMGIPTTHGEIEVQFLLHDNNNLTPIRQTLYINPNPQSLWQNIPSNPATVFYKTDEACEEHTTPEGTLLAARVRGRSHAHVGSCCDDDFALHYHPATHTHLLAVSDGAGSATFSRLGSQLAVQHALNTLLQLLNDPDKPFHQLPDITDSNTLKNIVCHLFTQAVYHAYKAQHDAVQQHDIIPDVKSLSCTLLLALSLPLKNGQWLSAAYWVGDGAAALWQPEAQELALLGSTDSGTFSGETRFLNAEEASAEKIQQRVHIKLSQQAPIIILMTDGVSDPKFETDANLAKAEYWRNLWLELQTPLSDENDPALALQTWLGFWSAGNHDDRTLALFLPNITEPTPNTHTETENA